MPVSATDPITAAGLAGVRRMSFAAVDAADPGVIFRSLAAELFGVFGIDSVHICRMAEGDTLGRGTVYEPLPDGTARERDEYMVPFDRPSGVHHVLATGAPLNVSDARSSEVVSRELSERFNVASMLYVPLTYERGVRAVVLLISESPRRFGGEEVDLVHTMANHAAGGLARPRPARPAGRPGGDPGGHRPRRAHPERDPRAARGAGHALPRGGGGPGRRSQRGVPGRRRRGRGGGGRTRPDRRVGLVRVPDRARRGRGRTGAGERRAGGVERLPGRGGRARRERDALRAHRRVRADVLERRASRGPLGGLLLGAADRGRGPRPRSRPSPASPPWPAARPRPSRRPGRRRAPTRSPAC